MVTHNTPQPSFPQENSSFMERSSSGARSRSGKGVTQARARAQRTKLDVQRQAHLQEEQEPASPSLAQKHQDQETHTRKRTKITLTRAIEDYLNDHEGGNHSPKTLEWHRTALGLMQSYLEQEREITLVTDIDAPDISGWFAAMRKTPGARGKIRSERTIQTYY